MSSGEFSSSMIQRDIDAKKQKLEALRQRRLARQQSSATLDDDDEERAGAISPILEAPSNDTSFASELDRPTILLNDSALGGASNGASLNTSFALDDSFLGASSDHLPPVLARATTTASPRKPAFGRRYSTLRASEGRAVTQQLLAIKVSLDQIAQHSVAPTPTHQKKISVAPPDFSPPSPLSPISLADPSTAATVAASVDPSSSQSLVIADLNAQIEQLREVLDRQASDLNMAGDLGSVLLTNNEEANRRIDELTTKLDDQAEEIFGLKEGARVDLRRAHKLQVHLTEMRHLQQEAESELEIARMELDLERQRTHQLEIEKARNSSTDQLLLTELTDELTAARQANAKLEAQHSEFRRAKEQAESALRNLKEEHADAQVELVRAEKLQHTVQDLQSQLQFLREQDTVNVLAELQYENQELANAMNEVTSHYEILQANNERDQELLRSLQLKNEALERQFRESRLTTQRARFESLADDEVLDDGSIPEEDADALTDATEPTPLPSPIPTPPVLPTQTPPVLPTPTPPPSLPTPTSPVVSAPVVAAVVQSPPPTPKRTVLSQLTAVPTAVALAMTSPEASNASLPSTPSLRVHRPSVSVADDDDILRAATAAAAMHLGSNLARRSLARASSLASGSASLVYAPSSASSAASTPLRPLKSGASRLSFESLSGTHPLTPTAGAITTPPRDLVPIAPMEGFGSHSRAASGFHSRVPSGFHSRAPSGQYQPSTRDANWEFFALTLLTVKIHSARKMESLYTVSTQDLWKRAKAEAVPFHEYYRWLEDALNSAYIQKLYSASGGSTDAVLDSCMASSFDLSSPSVNTAAARMQLQTPVANAPLLTAASASGAAGAAPVARILTEGQPPGLFLDDVSEGTFSNA